jgi:hypothetical protein
MAQLAVSPVERPLPDSGTVPAVTPTAAAEDKVRFERAMVEVAGAANIEQKGKAPRRKSATEVASPGDRILSGIDRTAPTATAKAVDDVPAPTAGVVTVSNGAQLAQALAQVRAGQHIQLEDGVYSAPGGRFDLKISGTVGAPIVIEAKNPLQARLTSDLRLSGSDQIASGLVFDGVEAEIAGDRSRITGSRSQNVDGIAITITRGHDTRVDHNELVGLHGRGISIKPSTANPQALLQPRIDHNWLHDFAGTRHDLESHAAIQVGQTLTHSDIAIGAIVEANLMERIYQCHSVISVKSSDNVIRNNTLLGSAGGIVNRHGERNLYEANWIEGARGMWIRDEDNVLIGNKIKDSAGYGLRILAGNVDPNSKQKGYPNAVNTVLIGNEVDRLIVGYGYSSAHIPARGTVIEGPQGAKVEIRMAQGTVELPNASVEVPEAVRLTRADVGPGAIASGVASLSDPPASVALGSSHASEPSVISVKQKSTPGERMLSSIARSSAPDESELQAPEFMLDPTQLASVLLANTNLWNPLLDRR